jgi:integrase
MVGAPKLVATLLYGGGLRLNECLELRVKDIDFAANQILLRDGKGQKDRITTLPSSVKEPLLARLRKVWRLHQRDLREGFGRVVLPYALVRKYPNADSEWAWHWAFGTWYAMRCGWPALALRQEARLNRRQQ